MVIRSNATHRHSIHIHLYRLTSNLRNLQEKNFLSLNLWDYISRENFKKNLETHISRNTWVRRSRLLDNWSCKIFLFLMTENLKKWKFQKFFGLCFRQESSRKLKPRSELEKQKISRIEREQTICSSQPFSLYSPLSNGIRFGKI